MHQHVIKSNSSIIDASVSIHRDQQKGQQIPRFSDTIKRLVLIVAICRMLILVNNANFASISATSGLVL